MIQTVAKAGMPVDEELHICKNRLSGTAGPRISIVTGIHGDELEGQFVCYELQRRIEEQPGHLHGTVDIYPALNPFGIDSVTRGIPAFDLDMNRIFPGRQDGDMNESVAAEILRDLEGSDLCVDIHASNIFLTEVPQIRINEQHTETLLPFAKLANVDLIWVHANATVLESTLAYSLNSRGVPTLVVEMGVGMRITREYGIQLTDGIFRMMAALGMWDGEIPEVRKPVISQAPDGVAFLNAPMSGIWVKLRQHGEQVRAGEPLGELVDPLQGKRLCTVESPVDGWLFTIREHPVADQGSLLARVLRQKGGQLLMERKVLYEIKALYRDDFRVTGFVFGSGEPSICIVGSMRGNENQQLYACSQLIRRLAELEEKGRLAEEKQILVIPCVNPYSMNIKKRFWSIDNTDINRMFPGYSLGETTQRIAAGVFEQVKDYPFGVQFASFYMPGAFVPHVRMMKTGYEDPALASQFGLPYVVLHTPRPFDTTTLNYNWQIWETHAFSVYTTNTASIDRASAKQADDAILHFMSAQGILRYRGHSGYISRVIESEDFLSLRAEQAGFFESFVRPGEEVEEGQLLARILDPYLGTERAAMTAPVTGTVAFVQDEAMTYESTAVLKLIRAEDI